MFKSATIKLTLWYVLLVMGLSILFSGALYHFSTHELAEGLRNQYKTLASNDNDGDDRNYVPTQELDARSQHLLQDLIYFNVFVFFGSSIASYALARRTLAPIEAAHQAQLRFTAEASHELRTPLTAMKADTEATLMQKSPGSAVLRRTLQDNLRDIEKLEKLANHLLEISRYKNEVAPAREDINLETVIQEALRQLRQSIRANHLKVKVKSISVRVSGDQQGLTQLITIVLDNAIKYSQPKGVISVTLKSANKYATIKVEDEGIGIRAEDLPHIFERFYRAQNAVTKKKDVVGYGLGLSLAKEIAELHGGSIEVKSKENKGTALSIKLPLA
jgi:signal transduction histidine kinase